MGTRKSLLLAAVCGCVSGCAAFKVGYRMPREEFRTTVKRVALAPARVTLDVLLPGNLDERAAWNARASVDEVLRPTLTSCGFEIISRDAAMDVIQQRVERVGVTVDRLGRVKKEELPKWRSAVIDALESQESTHADAVLFPVLAYRKGNLNGTTASWNGLVEVCTSASVGEVMAGLVAGPFGSEVVRQALSHDGIALVVEAYLVSSPSICVWYGSALISGMQEGKDDKFDSSGALTDESLIRHAAIQALITLDQKWKDPWENRSSLFEEKAP